MSTKTEYVNLSVSDGTSMRAYVAHPEGQPRAGLLVFQEAFGVNAHIREVTERFARQGYVAIAPELYHRTAPGFEGRYDDVASSLTLARTIQNDELEADARAAYDWLRRTMANGRKVAAVGFCMGGRAAFAASLTLPLGCGISFYGGGIAPGPNGPGLVGRAAELQCPVLLFWGGRDQHITPQHVRGVTDGLRAAGKNFVNVEISE